MPRSPLTPEDREVARMRRFIKEPYGMVLVTGPTGSGKTNTLYSSISRINTPETNIMTAEDPVEFNLVGVNQVQVRENIGLNFAAALRSFLRQDPNIILVGEIRDFETAEIAVKAALTGHLVLSTLHTNDAPSTVNRLMNMGIEPFLVATAVNCIAAQRLVRELQHHVALGHAFGPDSHEVQDVLLRLVATYEDPTVGNLIVDPDRYPAHWYHEGDPA